MAKKQRKKKRKGNEGESRAKRGQEGESGRQRGKGLAQVAQCFHLDLRVLLKGLRVAYLKRASDAETKGERERGGRGHSEVVSDTTLRHFNWILLNFDSDPHSCNCNKLYLLLLLIGSAR